MSQNARKIRVLSVFAKIKKEGQNLQFLEILPLICPSKSDEAPQVKPRRPGIKNENCIAAIT